MSNVTEQVEEVGAVDAEKPAAQTVGVVGGAEPQEQTPEERQATIDASKAGAKEMIEEAGEHGFVVVAMQQDNTAKVTVAGDYATAVHAVHAAVCALGSIVKQVQAEHDGNPEKHANVDDFVAGASVLTIHQSMLTKMHADAVAEAAMESAASTKQ